MRRPLFGAARHARDARRDKGDGLDGDGKAAIVAPIALIAPMAWFTGPSAPFRFTGAAFIVAALFAVAALILLRRLPLVAPLHAPPPHG